MKTLKNFLVPELASGGSIPAETKPAIPADDDYIFDGHICTGWLLQRDRGWEAHATTNCSGCFQPGLPPPPP